MLSQNHVLAKSVKSCNYCCYVRCLTLIVLVGGDALAQTGTYHYHDKLGTQDKGLAIKGLVFCYVYSMDRIYDLRDGPFDKCKVRCLVTCSSAATPHIFIKMHMQFEEKNSLPFIRGRGFGMSQSNKQETIENFIKK